MLLEEVGRHTSPVPYAPQLLALEALAPDDGRAGLVEALIGGRPPPPWPGRAGPGPSRWPGTGTEVALTGRLGPLEGATMADAGVVVVPDGVYLVDLVAVGRPRPEPAMDLTRSLSWLVLDDTPAVRLGGGDESARLGALGALATSAELLGGVGPGAGAGHGLRQGPGAVRGAHRQLPGRQAPLCRHAGRRRGHALGDLVRGLGGVAGEPGWELAASTAKVWCADASKRVMASGLQVHGGIGFTWEHDLHLFIKRAQFSQLDYGDASYHRSLLATGLRESVPAGIDVM